MILKNDDVIIEVKDNKAGSINFNENDPEYIPCKKARDLLDANPNFEMFSEETMKRVEDGEISRETMLAVGTKYGFSFDKDLGSNKLMLKFSGVNVAQILKSQYFRYYNRMAAFTNHDFNPWESEIFISAYMGAGRDSIDISKFTKTLKTQFSAQMKIVERRVEVLHALEEQENVESYAKELRDLNERVVAAFLHPDELYQVEDDGQVTFFPLWNEATAAAESLFNTFRQYTSTL